MKRFLFIAKRIFQLLFMVAVVVSFCVALTAAVNKKKQIVCSDVHINVHYKPLMQLIDEQEAEDEITHLSGRSIVGKPLSAIDFNAIEHQLEKNPYIKKAEIYYDQSNAVHANITQRVPLLRVINNNGVSYYLSEDLVKMPLHPIFTVSVPLAIGCVQTNNDTIRDSIVEQQLFELAEYITKDSVLKSLIDHIFVNEDGSFDLYPKMNYHTIYFGKTDDKMTTKFANLKAFYRDVLMKKGWEKYSRINISIPNQISAERSGEVDAAKVSQDEQAAATPKEGSKKEEAKPKVEAKVSTVKTEKKQTKTQSKKAAKTPQKTRVKKH